MSLHSKLIYLKYIAQGIKFLKDHDICHLDIKPTNILFGSGIVKLTDFGESYHPSICQKSIINLILCQIFDQEPQSRMLHLSHFHLILSTLITKWISSVLEF